MRNEKMMDFVNKNKVVIAVVLPILILVTIRSVGSNHFMTDATKLAKPSVLRSNIVSAEQTGILKGEILLINLGEESAGIDKITKNILKVPADSILNKYNLNTIHKHYGPVLLFSSEIAVSARIWMVLSQMGYKNIYILNNDTENEILKYKFRTDTLVKPEF